MNHNHTRNTVKIALENMYMFGGCPRPDPKYDQYLNIMIETVMDSIKPFNDVDENGKTVVLENVSLQFSSPIVTEENKINLSQTIIENINFYMEENFPNLNPQISIVKNKTDIFISKDTNENTKKTNN